jgi:hypothetical protein
MTTLTLTPASHETFMLYAEDADNWSGYPWVSDGNVFLTKEQRGNLSDLVQKGLITLGEDGGMNFVVFTEAGRAYAEAHGVTTAYWA